MNIKKIVLLMGMCMIMIGCTNERTQDSTKKETVKQESYTKNLDEEKINKRRKMSGEEIDNEIKKYWSDFLDKGFDWKYSPAEYGFDDFEKIFSVGKYKIEMSLGQHITDRNADGSLRISNPKKINVKNIVVKSGDISVKYNSVEAKTYDWDKNKKIYWTIWSYDNSDKQKEKYHKLKTMVESREDITIQVEGKERYILKGKKINKAMKEFIELSDELISYYY